MPKIIKVWGDIIHDVTKLVFGSSVELVKLERTS